MRPIIILITFSLFFIGFRAYSQAEKAEKRQEIGLFYATGSFTDWGNNANDYSKNKFNGFSELGAYNLWVLPNKKYSFKAEYSAKFMSPDYQFPTGELGIVNQSIQGLNFKFGRNFGTSNSLDCYLGPGFYTVYQKRIPGLNSPTIATIKDGFFAYWGMSIEFEIAASIPFGSGRMGVGTRVFVQPPFTIASKVNVPTFYHNGFSISWFITR